MFSDQPFCQTMHFQQNNHQTNFRENYFTSTSLIYCFILLFSPVSYSLQDLQKIYLIYDCSSKLLNTLCSEAEQEWEIWTNLIKKLQMKDMSVCQTMGSFFCFFISRQRSLLWKLFCSFSSIGCHKNMLDIGHWWWV